MRFHFIRRKVDGRYLYARNGPWSARVNEDKSTWSKEPTKIIRTPDGVRQNLVKLCSKVKYDPPYVPLNLREMGVWYAFSGELIWHDYNPAHLERFEVLAMDLVLKDQTIFEAAHFVKEDQAGETEQLRREVKRLDELLDGYVERQR